jgi:tetratricopeptide (TPR) repeat protein
VLGDMAAAERHFRRVVELAPGFAPAWANLIVCHFNTGDCEAAAAAVEEMEASCSIDRPGPEYLRRFFRARLEGQWEAALAALQSIEALIPNDGPTKIVVATTALRAGRPRLAVEACSSIRLRGRFVRHPASVVRCRLIASAHHVLGEHDRELAQIRAVAEVIPNPIAVLGLEVRALAAAGRLEEVEEVLDHSLSVPAAQALTGRLMFEAAVEMRVHGQRSAAMEMAGRAIAWVERQGRDRAPGDVLGGALCVAERWLEARELYERGAADELDALGAVGWLSIRVGDEARAGEVDTSLRQIRRPFLYGEPELQRACIEAHRGNRDRAVELLGAAFAGGLPHDERLHRDLGLQPLWDEPKFRKLIGP